MSRFRLAGAVFVPVFLLGFFCATQPLPKIPFEKYTLSNGLQVILQVNKKIPAVNVNLWYHVGSKNEKPGRTGFAHLFEHMMFQGSKHVEGEYIQVANMAGANRRNINGTTNEDRTNYFETVPTSSLEYAIWLESDRMGFLLDAMTAEKLKNQQDVVKNEKRQGDNSPYSAIQYLVAENLYPVGHPYAHTVIGSIEDLTSATLDDVKEFFRKWYAPNNACLTLCGDFDPAVAKQLVQKYFGPLPGGEPISRPAVDIPVLGATKRISATDRAPQPLLYITYPVPQRYSPEEAPLDFAASVFGQGKTSILYKKLVRELQIASNVTVSNSSSEIAGEFTIRVTARPGQSLDEIRKIVDEEIAVFSKNGPGEEEISRERAQHAMRFFTNLERIGGFGGVADQLQTYNTFLGNPDYFQQDFDRFQSVTADQVRREFSKWIAGANRLEIAITPEKGGRANGKEFDRTKPPVISATPPFEGPKVESSTLDNGLEVHVVTRKELPIVSMQMFLKTTPYLEAAEKAGQMSLSVAMMDEGTTKRNAIQIQEDLDKLGSSMSIGGSKLGASASLTALISNLDATMEILSDVVLHPAFPADEFTRQQKQTLDGILQMKNRPAAVVGRMFMKALHGAEHPLGIPSGGTEASVKNLTVADLKQSYETYWKPNNAVMVFVGDISLGDARKLAGKHFGGWRKGSVPEQAIPAAKGPTEHTIYLVDRQNAPQSQIMIGSLAPMRSTKDFYPITVMNTVLGGAFGSRLNLNLREDKGYTYGAGSNFTMEKNYGYWAASAGVQTKFTKESLIEFRKEIDGISGSRILTGPELDDIKDNLTRGYAQNYETNALVMGRVASLLNQDVPFDDMENYIPAVAAQTPESVVQAAKRYVDFNRSITVVVGDLSQIQEGIRNLNWGKVIVLDEDGNPVK